MLRLALIDGNDSGGQYSRIAPRIGNARFTAVVDRDVQTARNTARSLGAEIWTDSFEKLVADHSAAFDAVVLQSACRFDNRHCQRAAETGKHILVESPVALSRDAALEVISACQQAGVRLMVAQASRFSPSVRIVKESLDAGRLGEPGLLRIHRWNVAGTLRVPSASTPSVQAPTGTTRSVDVPSATAHGVCLLLQRVIRDIDLACWLFGRRPSEVYAVGCNTLARSASEGDISPSLARRATVKPGQSMDYVQLHLGFAGGGMAVIDYSETLPRGDGYFALSLIGSTGAAYADDHHNMQLLYGAGQPSALHTGEADLPVLAQLQEFIDAIEQNREPLINRADDLRAIEVAEAAAAALATGQAVHLAQEVDP